MADPTPLRSMKDARPAWAPRPMLAPILPAMFCWARLAAVHEATTGDLDAGLRSACSRTFLLLPTLPYCSVMLLQHLHDVLDILFLDRQPNHSAVPW
jgi:hypothetical protein